MSNPFVQVNVAQQSAPTPSQRQKTGALISQGGTTLAAGAKSLLTQLSDLTPLLTAPIALASLTQAAGVATATLASSNATAGGTYNATTGQVTLILAASIGQVAGGLVAISAATGSGASAINGVQTIAAGSSGTTLIFFVPTGLTMTITGATAALTTGLANGSTFLTAVAGAAQTGYNITAIATVTGTSTFTYAVATTTISPATGVPTFTSPNRSELLQMATTFFNQGSVQAVYVLELGAGTPAQGVAALAAFITANPPQPGAFAFYSYLVPRGWDAVASFLTFLNGFLTTTSQTYFFVTTTIANYALYAAMKCVKTMIEAPGVQTIEFSHAADFWVTLNYAPASTNRVTPLNFSFLFGVTPYPTAGNAALLATLSAANVGVVGTGAQGGSSDKILIGGNMMDGNPFNYWYSVDWTQINVQLNVTAAAIAGSNNPTNPLYYDQAGINSLQQVAISTMNTGISDGLVLNPVQATTLSAAAFQIALDNDAFAGFTAVNADPFASYVRENPNDYAIGRYTGFSIEYVPLRGFDSIVFNVTVSTFAS